MKASMYEQTLIQSGLDKEQALLYEVLLKNGRLSAGAAHKLVPLKRGLVYKVLDELAELGLVEKKQEEGKMFQFSVTHPLTLKELAEKREQEAKDAKMALEGVLPSLVSDFNLVSGKPGVRFLEGEDGVWEILTDTLQTKGVMYTYADIEAVDSHIREMNERYAKKRDALNIEKKVILLDTPYARERMKTYHRFVTDTRFIKLDAEPFQSIIEIYDDKIAYITFGESMRGVIIQDKAIHSMHRALFDYAWSTAQPLQS
jgi:sugar-specific transcriptional regulator TrmB